jgi:hypothetical protein
MTKRPTIAALGILLIATTATADSVMVYSFKDDSCGKWSSYREPHSRETVAYWTRGFITAYNWFNNTDQVTRELSNATIIAYIDKFCGDFPLKDVPQATASLICEAREGAARPSQFCEPVDPRGPKAK